VVATTFSRKAAAEIRVRVTQEIERLAQAPATSAYIASLRPLALSAGARSGLLSDDDVRVRARRALTRLPFARFGTLHSFATSIVRGHAVELGLGPGFELASEGDARARAEDAIAKALEACLAKEPGNVHALAEAAGGVDRLVVQLRRILTQLEEDGRSARDLALPTGDAEHLEVLLAQLVDHAQALQVLPRFEGAASALISAWQSQDEASIEAASGDFSAVPATGKRSAELEAFAVFRKTLPGATNEERGRRLARAYRARHRFLEQARLVREVLGAAELAIERDGRTRASIGFGEVLRAARELLRDRPDVATEIGAAIDALLVDEFQDTSRVQRDLIQLLWARPGTREAGTVPSLAAVREGGLLVVGDRKQSIYGFRGADVGVFAEIAVGLAGAPAREALGIPPGVTWEPPEPLADFCALRHNRRSVPEVLAFANSFSARRFSPGAPPPELFEIEYVPATEDLLVPPERVQSTAPVSAVPRATWLRVQPRGASSSRLEEALVIAARIQALSTDASFRVGPEARPARWRDMAILATTNGMLDAAAFALAQVSVPYVVAGKSFFRTREVRDLAALLSLVLEPSDPLPMLEVLRGPWVGVHDETLLGLTRGATGLVAPSSWSSPPHPELVRPEDRSSLADTARLIEELARCAGRLGPGAILREAVRARALEEVLAALPRGEQRLANVRKLLAIADSHHDPRAFREWLDDASEQQLAESEAATFSQDDDAVRLLTVHASKGLDFPVVFVPEIGAALPRSERGAARILLGAGDAPNVLSVRVADSSGTVLDPPSFERAYATTRRRERAERQRLAYVAVTRAADALFLVGGRVREGGGDRGASTLAVLEELVAEPRTHGGALLVVEDVAVPPAAVRRDQAWTTLGTPHVVPAQTPVPAWRNLPIAPTALADFDHCARRFELVHILGLPEHVRGARVPGEARAAAGHSVLDARTQGTLAHAVLERVPTSAFSGGEAHVAASAALVAEGVPVGHPEHASIVARVSRFLSGVYARTIALERAELRREVPFVLAVDDAGGRSVVLRGSMDLLVVWGGGNVDVVDYKSARGGAAGAYGFQLDVYALAARAMFPDAPRLRTGLVYLGGESAGGEPAWRERPNEADVRARLARMGAAVVHARWSGAFPRVALEQCEAIFCGFIGRCHPTGPPVGGSGSTANGTEANPPRATTT
jgi:ATP-dependent helicase/nuclease subunit A